MARVALIGAVQIASAAEGMALAERAGLDLDLVSAALASGQAASPQVVRNVRRIAAGLGDQNESGIIEVARDTHEIPGRPGTATPSISYL